MIKFVRDLQQVGGFLRVLQFPPPIKLTAIYNWSIVESGVKHHSPNNMQSVPITTNIVSLNPTQARCVRYNISWWSLSVTCGKSGDSSTNKTDRHNITEILLNVALSTISLILNVCTKVFMQLQLLNSSHPISLRRPTSYLCKIHLTEVETKWGCHSMDFLKENKIIITKLYYLFVKKNPVKKKAVNIKQ